MNNKNELNVLKGVNLYLVGMMGTGKTTTGRALATKLSYRFVDTDEIITQVTQQSISELFATSGEPAFRQIETQVLARVCAYTHLAIATGGGIVLQRENWSYLHHGLIVWLDAPTELLYTRLNTDETRPLLQAGDLRTQLETIKQQRQPLYSQADLRVVVTFDETPEQLATRILQEIPQVLKKSTPQL